MDSDGLFSAHAEAQPCKFANRQSCSVEGILDTKAFVMQ